MLDHTLGLSGDFFPSALRTPWYVCSDSSLSYIQVNGRVSSLLLCLLCFLHNRLPLSAGGTHTNPPSLLLHRSDHYLPPCHHDDKAVLSHSAAEFFVARGICGEMPDKYVPGNRFMCCGPNDVL